ncbi:MAG: cupin domain-containing protein [Deltaproteobacteria bacterium]|nr:MAG: cupin domain-containing protein [Deltaproteobacteria bacterium]
MDDFPDFLKNPLNKIASKSQYTEDIEGYVFDGADGSQVAFWKCRNNRLSETHTHDYDEYMMVVQGKFTLIIDNRRIPLVAGQEYYIPRGVTHAGEVTAGTRTIHVFGGKRLSRENHH